MKCEHTNKMPWDDMLDTEHYRLSRVRMIKYKVKIINENNRKERKKLC